ncbi:MAG: hypothetical protein GXP41_02935 [Chloroflexi bacterium]|nr:hypothetical protein [Chloroflexota bacterium]
MPQTESLSQRSRAAIVADRLLAQLGPGPDLSTMLAQEGRSFAPAMRGGGGSGRRRTGGRRHSHRQTTAVRHQTREREKRLRFRLMEHLGLLPRRQ